MSSFCVQGIPTVSLRTWLSHLRYYCSDLEHTKPPDVGPFPTDLYSSGYRGPRRYLHNRAGGGREFDMLLFISGKCILLSGFSWGMREDGWVYRKYHQHVCCSLEWALSWHRYLAESTWPWGRYLCLTSLRRHLILMTWHFFGFNVICHLVFHLASWSRSFADTRHHIASLLQGTLWCHQRRALLRSWHGQEYR